MLKVMISCFEFPNPRGYTIPSPKLSLADGLLGVAGTFAGFVLSPVPGGFFALFGFPCALLYSSVS